MLTCHFGRHKLRRMKRPFHTISLDELDSVVRDATVAAAMDSLARGLPVTGTDADGMVVTYHPATPKSSPLEDEAGHVKAA